MKAWRGSIDGTFIVWADTRSKARYRVFLSMREAGWLDPWRGAMKTRLTRAAEYDGQDRADCTTEACLTPTTEAVTA